MRNLTLTLLSLLIATGIFAADAPTSSKPAHSQASQSKIYFTRGKKGTKKPKPPRKPTKVPKRINPYKYYKKNH